MRAQDAVPGLLRRTAAVSIAAIGLLAVLPAAQAGSASVAAGSVRGAAPRVLDVVLVRPTAATLTVQVRLSAPVPAARTVSVRLADGGRSWPCRPHGQRRELSCPVADLSPRLPVRIEVQI